MLLGATGHRRERLESGRPLRIRMDRFSQRNYRSRPSSGRSRPACDALPAPSSARPGPGP